MIVNYLYYKLYRAALKSSLNDIAVFAASVSTGGLIGLNLMVINMFLENNHIIPLLISSDNFAKGFMLFCISMSLIYFMINKRYEKILKKYSNESNKQRRKGNIIVAFYVAISFLSIFAVAFFK